MLRQRYFLFQMDIITSDSFHVHWGVFLGRLYASAISIHYLSFFRGLFYSNVEYRVSSNLCNVIFVADCS